MPYGLPPSVIDKLMAVFREDSRIKKVWLYGSRAKGNPRPGSDIDLCLEAPSLEFRNVADLETRIDDLLLPWKVDLSLMHKIDNSVLLTHIKQAGIDLLEGDRARNDPGGWRSNC